MKVEELEYKIELFANKIQAPDNLLPKINESNDFAYPYIDSERGDLFYYVIRERGVEYERSLYRYENDILYRIFKDITFSMAIEYELKHRIETQDFRILLFKKQEELMGQLNSDWEKTIKTEHDSYLKI